MAQAFITRRGGGSGGVNQTLPEQLTAFTAVADNTPQITLSWENPTEYWAGTLIVKKAGSAPEGVNDGEKIYNGTGTSFTDTAVEYDTEYFYRAFPYNAKKQYQTEVLTVSAMPVNVIPFSELPEGTVINIPENGVLTPFYLAKHDYESGLNGAGRQLMVRKIGYDLRKWHSSTVNAYATSTIDSWLNGTYKLLFSEAIQELMETTKFYYTKGNGTNTVTTLSRSVFLLSLTELGYSHTYAKVEGSALPILDLLKDGIKYDGGGTTTYGQWTRTPATDDTYAVYALVGYAASGDGRNFAWWDANGVNHASRPCFTLPADMCVDPTPNADGSYNLLV